MESKPLLIIMIIIAAMLVSGCAQQENIPASDNATDLANENMNDDSAEDQTIIDDEGSTYTIEYENTDTEDEQGTEDYLPVVPDNNSSANIVEDEQPEPKIVEIDLVAKKWEWVPAAITVNEGDTVILNITSIDVEHGISLPQFDVDESFGPGDNVLVEFVANKKGIYRFRCNVYCGAGHSDMDGTLTIN